MTPMILDVPPLAATPAITMVAPDAAMPAASTGAQVITSDAFGVLEVPAMTMMHFAVPLLGFPEERTFSLLPAMRDGLWWMLSESNSSLTFLLADPFISDPGYVLDITETDERTLGLTTSEQALALVLVAFPNSTDEPVTANFRAPLVFNLATQTVLQVVSRNESHSMRHPIDLASFEMQDDGLRLD